MVLQHIKISIRSLLKNKSFSLINIIGLSLGFASVLTLGLLVHQYYTTDAIHVNKDRIYYLKTHRQDGTIFTSTPFPLLYEVQKAAPEVEAVTHVQQWSWPWLKYNTQEAQDKTTYVDTGFFKVFTFPFIEGNSATALRQKNGVVLSKKMAVALFGKETALGKTIMADDTLALTVTGVLGDIPSNVSVKTEVLMSLELIREDPNFTKGANWYNTIAENYLLLRKDADPKLLDAKMKQIVQQFYVPEQKTDVLRAEPFSNKRSEDDSIIKAIVTSAIAASFFILIIILANLLNLNAATMFKRTKEVAVRQMVGSGRRHIVMQFCIENALVVLLSLMIGFLFFLYFLLPQVNEIMGSQYNALAFQWRTDYPLVLFFLLIAIVVTVIAGGYPALHLTSVKVTDAIKGKVAKNENRGALRTLFIGVQFMLAVVLICVAISFNAQIKHMKGAALGFDKDNVTVVRLDLDYKDGALADSRFKTILNTLGGYTYVKSFSTTPVIPTAYWQDYNDYFDVATGKKVNLRQTATDAGYVPTYSIPITEGRNFNDSLVAGEGNNIILNEAAVKAFGWTNAVGKQIQSGGSDEVHTVIGVLKNFYYDDLQKPVGPLVHTFRGKPSVYNKYLSVRVDKQHRQQVIAQLEQAFKSLPARRPFSYHTMNELVAEQYGLLTGILKITNYVALLTIFIASMGMFGLISIFASRRTKEIGIRKVLGASVASITALVSKDFIKVVLVATIIAIPVAAWLMRQWLQDFAYRVPLQWWMFALGSAIALLIAAATVGFQAIKAAVANPVKSLRSE